MNSIEKILSDAENVGLWESLVPSLSITDTPFSTELAHYEVSPEQSKQISEQMIEEGYFNLESVLPGTDIHPIANAIRTLVNNGVPPVFCFVYDETWQVFARLNQVLEPILGQNFKLQPTGNWAWYIDGGCAGFAPHRDLLHLKIDPDGHPTNLTVWIPFTDATLLNGCMYVLPINLDPNYPGNLKQQGFDVQCIRPLPAKAGSVLGWNANIIHWGARSSHQAAEPRISIGVSYNQANSNKYTKHCGTDYSLVDGLSCGKDTAIPLDYRLNHIGESIWNYKFRVAEMWPESAAVLFEFSRTHYTSLKQADEVNAEAGNIIVKTKTSIAQRLWQNGNRIEAQIIMQQLCEAYPNNAGAWKDRGMLEFELKDLNMAESCFRRAILLRNDLVEAHKCLKIVLRQKNITK